MREISESGFVGKGGVLHLPKGRIRQFLSRSPEGSRVIARFIVVSPGTTEAQKAYYYNYIIPEVQAAMLERGTRLSEEGADEFLVGEYPGDKRTVQGYKATKGKELDKEQMSDFIDWLKQFAAENLDVGIEDARLV